MAKTFMQVIRDKTDEYLRKINLASPPPPDKIEEDILRDITFEFDSMNALVLKGQKRFVAPQFLIPMQIATILAYLYPICRIQAGAQNSHSSNDLLAVYCETGEDAGTYVDNDEVLFLLAKQYKYGLSEKEFEDIQFALRSLVPVKTRTTDRDLIAVNNGIFNYATKTLMPFSPQYVFTSKSHVNYVDNPKLPIYHNSEDGTDWDVESWLSELSDDADIVNSIWEVIGAILRPHVRWNKAAWFYSETGNNGKGTLCSLMRNIIGGTAYASIPISDFSKDFLLEPLTRSQAIIVDENDVGIFIDKAANLKAVITNDVIQINRKFKTPIAYQFFGFMVQCLNEMPRVKDRSDSFYRRQLFIPFNKCFTGKERKYIKDDYLTRSDTLEYVLWKVLNMNYYTLSEPDACKAVLAEYKEYNDPIRQFATDMLPECVWDFLPFTFLYDLYKSWFKKASPSGTPIGRNVFITELLTIIKSNNYGWFCEDKSKQIRIGDMMSKPEPLIIKYDLNDWKNKSYRGNEIEYICTPPILLKARGIQRISTYSTD